LALVMLGALPGGLSVGLLYLVVAEAYGPTVGVTAAGLMALERWYVMLTRKGDDIGLALALALAAIWFAARGMRSGRSLWLVLAGVAVGVNLIYLYVGALAAPAVFLVWLLLARSRA